MSRNTVIVFFSIMTIFLLSSFSATSAQLINLTRQENASTAQLINVKNTTGSIILDGHLTDDIWKDATTIDLNIVNFPSNNTASPIKTTAKVVENGDSIFIAFIAEDPIPENIQSYYGDRDTRWNDDLVGIKLDSQNNHNLNYEFIVNPVGMQMDSIQNNITDEKNESWDGIWHSFGRITNTGYVVEMEIPLRILSFDTSNDIKTWPIEFFRIYPRDTWLRISHVPLDKNIDCKTCQYPLITGFKNVNNNQNVLITPAVVASNTKTRDIFDPERTWENDNIVELGIDVSWNINNNTRLNATINPDFSFIEADAGQLNVNENFALTFEEKRPFFIENSEYFASDFDLIYTRNITDPRYGVKLTGNNDKHTYGLFAAKDEQTNFILSNNLSSDIVSINDESFVVAAKYQYDISKNHSLGAITTARKSSDYHNYVAGFDTKLQFNPSNSLLAQYVISNTQNPSDFIDPLCTNILCKSSTKANKDSFSDQAIKINLQHRSEYWEADYLHQEIGRNFRADLGFLSQADIKEDNLTINRLFFAEQDAFWQEAKINAVWGIQKSEAGELISRTVSTTASIDGPYQSNYEIRYEKSSKVGLRNNNSISNISGNTTLFELEQLSLFSAFKPSDNINIQLNYIAGDEIDFTNNRLGKINELSSYISWFVTQHIEIELSHTTSILDADNSNVFKALLIDTRINYQFNALSQLKFSVVYSDVEHNLSNNPINVFSETERVLSSQLIYSYKINPQTVFFLGYSDNSFQDDSFDSLQKEDRTFFTKISYAWLP